MCHRCVLINIFLQTLPLYITGGSYLAFFFMISHNFEGAQALKDTTRPSNKGGNKNSFLYKQVPLIIKFTRPLWCNWIISLKVVSSSNVGGWFLCHLHGGLNYQIEHHLFPRMNHCHYPKIAPTVRYDWCYVEACRLILFIGVWLDLGNSAKRRTSPTNTSPLSLTTGRALRHTSLIWVKT